MIELLGSVGCKLGVSCDLFAVSKPIVTRIADDPSLTQDLSLTHDRRGAGAGAGVGLGASVSLEKSWHGLHYTLTGSAWAGEPPLNFLVSGGEPIGKEFVGYGSSRLLRHEQVVALNAALSLISQADFARRFNLAGLAKDDIYPQTWDEPLDELLDEYWWYFTNARTLITQAARAGQSLLIVMH